MEIDMVQCLQVATIIGMIIGAPTALLGFAILEQRRRLPN
jgi:hypothetical protein